MKNLCDNQPNKCCKKREKKCDEFVIINSNCCPCPPPFPPLPLPSPLFQAGLLTPFTLAGGLGSTTVIVPFSFASAFIDTYLVLGASAFGSGVSLDRNGYWIISANLSASVTSNSSSVLPVGTFITLTAEIVLNAGGPNEDVLISETSKIGPALALPVIGDLPIFMFDGVAQIDPEIIRNITGPARDVSIRLTVTNSSAILNYNIIINPLETVFRGSYFSVA